MYKFICSISFSQSAAIRMRINTRRSTAQPDSKICKPKKKCKNREIRVYSRNKGPTLLQKKRTEKLDQRKDETFSFLYWPDSHFVGDFVCRGWCVLVCRKRAENLWRYARREREFFRTDFVWVFYPLLSSRSRHDPVFRFRLLLILSLFNLPRLSPSNAFFTT
jgi:hypothetical protein